MVWINRRDFLTGVGSHVAAARLATLAMFTIASGADARTKSRPGGFDSALVERWMDQWISATRLPAGTLEISRFKEPIYFLLKPIGWKPSGEQSSTFQEVTVPVGFVTDFASIPREFWSLLRPDGEYAYAAVIHDYLYWTQSRSRLVSDKIFRLAMQDFDVGAVTATTIYEAVRIGGGFGWRENARLKAAGERRILKEFPDDPRVTWIDWKKDPNHFRDPD